MASAAPVAATETAPDSGPTILLWGKPAGKQGADAPGQPFVTYRLRESGDRGVVLGSEPGIVIAAQGREWAWTTAKIKAPTVACEKRTGADHDAPAVESTMTHGRFILKGGSAYRMVRAPDLPTDANEVRENVTLTGSVGSYVFVHTSSYRYGCGSLGVTVAGFFAWDLEHDQPVELLDEVVQTEALKAQGQRQLNKDKGDDDPEVRNDKPDLVEVRPSYDALGQLSLTARLARVSSGDSDGEWSMGTRSALLRTPLSARLRPYAEAPSAVRGFLNTHPGFTLHGWSRR